MNKLNFTTANASKGSDASTEVNSNIREGTPATAGLINSIDASNVWKVSNSMYVSFKHYASKSWDDSIRSKAVPEFIEPVLGAKMIVFAKISPIRSFSIQSCPNL